MKLTKQQVEELELEQCHAQLKKLAGTYPLNTELAKLNAATLAIVDDIANSLLYLEDRIKHIEQTANLEKANAARWNREE